jgi:hypothetical protein
MKNRARTHRFGVRGPGSSQARSLSLLDWANAVWPRSP